MKAADINLIPPERLRARLIRRRRRAWTLILVLHSGLLAAGSMVARQIWTGGNPATAAELTDTRKHIGKLTIQIAQLRHTLGELQAQQNTNQAIEDQPDWSELLDLLDQSVGDDVVLRQLSFEPVAGTSKLKLSLSGFAKSQASVSQFVLRLQQSKLFAELKPQRSEREPIMDTPAIAFELLGTMDDPKAGAQ